MHAISSYRGNRPTNMSRNTYTNKQTHTQDRLQYTAPLKLSAQCNYYCAAAAATTTTCVVKPTVVGSHVTYTETTVLDLKLSPIPRLRCQDQEHKEEMNQGTSKPRSKNNNRVLAVSIKQHLCNANNAVIVRNGNNPSQRRPISSTVILPLLLPVTLYTTFHFCLTGLFFKR